MDPIFSKKFRPPTPLFFYLAPLFPPISDVLLKRHALVGLELRRMNFPKFSSSLTIWSTLPKILKNCFGRTLILSKQCGREFKSRRRQLFLLFTLFWWIMVNQVINNHFQFKKLIFRFLKDERTVTNAKSWQLLKKPSC